MPSWRLQAVFVWNNAKLEVAGSVRLEQCQAGALHAVFVWNNAKLEHCRQCLSGTMPSWRLQAVFVWNNAKLEHCRQCSSGTMPSWSIAGSVRLEQCQAGALQAVFVLLLPVSPSRFLQPWLAEVLLVKLIFSDKWHEV